MKMGNGVLLAALGNSSQKRCVIYDRVSNSNQFLAVREDYVLTDGWSDAFTIVGFVTPEQANEYLGFGSHNLSERKPKDSTP
jgi:hypothetical protein